MNVLRGILFENLGLKLVALLLAVVVYLNVYTDRPATMVVTFPVQLDDLADTLAIEGPAPGPVKVELKGTAKQLIRLRVSEPPIKISLAGAGVGRFERALGMEDLPLPEGQKLEVNRIVSPRVIELQLDRKGRRSLPVAPRVVGEPASGVAWSGTIEVTPERVTLEGPARVLAALDSVRLLPVSIAGKHDTVEVLAAPEPLGDWTISDPERVEIAIPLEATQTRRFPIVLEPQGNARPLPARVVAVVNAPRRLTQDPSWKLDVTWSLLHGGKRASGTKAPVTLRSPAPHGVRVRFEPDSVTVIAGS